MKFLIIIAFILTVTVSVTSCTKADVQFGSEFLDNQLTQIIKIDSFTPSLSTVYLDSFITSAKGVALIGSYNDSYFGRVSSETFFELNPPGYADIYSQTMFDSIRLILKPNGSYYGDTTKPIHFNTYRLSELIVSKNFDVSNNYYNNQSFMTGNIMGSESQVVYPQSKQAVSLKIQDTVGINLLTLLQDPNNTVFQNNINFLNYLNGMKISAGNSDQTMIGFSDTITMRLYYRKGGPYPQYGTADFVLSNKAHQFNHITVDRSAISDKVIQTISANNYEIPSTSTGNVSYMQTISGLMTKIRFNSINQVQNLPNYAKILSAQLVIRPVVGTYNRDSYSLPPYLRLSSTNGLNQLGTDILSTNGAGIQTGSLFVDYLNGTGTAYTYDLTSYIKSILNNPTAIANGILVSPPSPYFETTASRVVIGNNFNINGQTQLLIYYASVQ